MKRISTILSSVLLLASTISAQVAINTDGSQADASAIMDVKSTEQGFLPPRMTSAERDAISSPASGLTIYNTDDNCLEIFQSPLWYNLCTHSMVPGPPADCPPSLEITADETVVVDIANSTTGETWMDRNLGAVVAGRSSGDCWAFGNLYQWGRASEGHEFRTSSSTLTKATTAVPNEPNPSWDGLFIRLGSLPSLPYDWLTPQDNTLWLGVSGTNNPCPAGYRLPISSEFSSELSSWSSGGLPYGDSQLEWLGAGWRDSGGVVQPGSFGRYWSSTVSLSRTKALEFSGTLFRSVTDADRVRGYSVRCIKD